MKAATSLTNIVGPVAQNTCTGGALKCSDDNAQVLICMNNQWMTKEACANGCSNGACISAQTPKTCTKGTLKCSNDNTKVQLCKNNSWTTLANCPDGCTNGACITHKPAKTCAEGALKCSDDNTHVLVCANDTWLTKETCDHGCTNGVCVTDIPAPTCNEGALKCSDDNKQALVCSNDAWIIKEYCAGGCADGACIVAPEPTCTNGMPKCSDDGTQALACRQNQWTVIETCTNGCVGSGCITSGPETDDNHNHMNDAYETAPNQGKACRKYADCDTAPGKGDGFCDSFIGYKCSTKCTSDDQCVDDDEFHYICRPDGRCAPDTFTFVINIKKNEDNDYRFSLDTDYISDCNFTIDWGDSSRIKKYESKTALPLDDMGNFSHNNLVPGIYTVKIKGKYDGFNIANDESFLVVSEDGDASYYMSHYIVEIKSFGPVGLGRWGEFALEDYRNLNKLSQVDIPDASKLTSLRRAFSPNYDNSASQYIEPLFNAPLNNWDISNVTNLSHAFYNARFYNQPLNDWDISNVTDLSYAFYNARFYNQPLNHWDTSNVTDMRRMFLGANAFNQPLDNWNTSNVKDMSYMFYNATAFNSSINNWDILHVTNMNSMFYNATAFNQPMNWNATYVKDMRSMFNGATSFNQDISGWRKNYYASQRVHTDSMFKNSAMSQENYCKIANSWNYNGDLGMDYTCH